MDQGKTNKIQLLAEFDNVIFNDSLKKKGVIKAFSTMNISLLEVLLDEEKTYGNATKETFLKKTEEVFQKFKEENDTALIQSKGKCISCRCPERGKGFSFMGNNSENYIDLIFKESDLEFIDIYHCSQFETSEIRNTNKQFSLRIYDDEEAPSKIPRGRAIRIQKCNAAIAEIMVFENKVLPASYYINWLTNHSELREFFELPPFFNYTYSKFYDLYSALKRYHEFPNFENETSRAISIYDEIDVLNEAELLKWLLLFEDLGNDLTAKLEPFRNGDNKYFSKLSRHYNIFIDLDDYKNIIEFMSVFDKHYWSVLAEYEAGSDEISFDMDENKSSLNYYMNKKKSN